MLYLVGGPPRVGKSILSQRLATRLGCSWFPLDLLRETLGLASPQLDSFDWRDPTSMATHAERFRPFLERFLGMADAVADDFVIEGLELTPSMLAILRDQSPAHSMVVVCTRPDLEMIRRFSGRWGTWLEDLDEASLSGFPETLRECSARVVRECQELDLPFIDTTGGFDAAIQRGMDALVDPQHREGA